MPIYEYRCEACGYEFEELVPGSAKAKRTTCPKCQSPRAHRKLSVFSAHGGTAARSAQPSPGPCSRCGQADGPCPMADF